MSSEFALMSVDGVNFKQDLSYEDIQKAIVKKITEEDLTEEEIDEVYNSITLSPVSSLNGKDMYYYNLNGEKSKVELSTKMYISFDIYFKSNFDEAFTLYFNTDDINTDLNEQVTKINSTSTLVNSKNQVLKHNFSYYNSLGEKVNVEPNGEELEIYAKDAIRFSTEVDGKVKIYEPNLGLGSYATTINSDEYSGIYKPYLSRYDSAKNASFTYVQNEGFGGKALEYADLPHIYQGFEEVEALEITSFNYYQETKKVTFTFWLEGFDADCIDAIIDNMLEISLSFRGSTNLETYRIRYHNNSQVEEVEYINSPLRSGNNPLFITRHGYRFGGWYEDEACTIEFNFNLSSLLPVRNAYLNWIKI